MRWFRWATCSPVRAEAVAALALALAALPAKAAVTCGAYDMALSLGTYDSFNAAPADSSGVLVVTCSRNGGPRTTAVTLSIGPSQHTGGIATRSLRHATSTDLLNYNLYRDASRLQVWGDTPGINTLTQGITLDNRTSGTLTFTIFGRIDPGQDVRPGPYADRLRLTISF